VRVRGSHTSMSIKETGHDNMPEIVWSGKIIFSYRSRYGDNKDCQQDLLNFVEIDIRLSGHTTLHRRVALLRYSVQLSAIHSDN
jgi:hypothetical protein